jgi:CBS domain containing-hemolysin-like protein
MEFTILLHVGLVFLMVVLSVAFSATETSLLCLSKVQVNQGTEYTGLMGMAYQAWMKTPNRLLTTILVGNNGVNIFASFLAAHLAEVLSKAHGWNPFWTGVSMSLALTFVIVVFGEVIPKVTARTFPQKVSAWLIVPLYLLDRMISPFTWFLNAFLRALLPRSADSSASVVTEEDIKLDLEMGVKSGAIEAGERKMIDSIFRFSDKKVGQVMLPRTEMTAVDMASPVEAVVDLAVQTGFSRVPVYKGNRDNIVGVLHTRDLLSVWKHRELIVLQDILRPPFFVPASMPVDRLLREFQKGRFHMAVVVDEYGGTAGVVTLEDLVEEIIGDIRDEHEVEEEKPIVRNEDGSYTVEAGAPLDKVNEIMGLKLEPKGKVASLGGYVVELAGKVPKKGRSLSDDQAEFTVIEADARKIDKIRVVKLEAIPPKPETPKKARKKKAPEKPVPFEPVFKDEPPSGNE